MSLTYKRKELLLPELRQSICDKWMWLVEGGFERSTIEVGRYGFDMVREN
jgi:hypothetical protein